MRDCMTLLKCTFSCFHMNWRWKILLSFGEIYIYGGFLFDNSDWLDHLLLKYKNYAWLSLSFWYGLTLTANKGRLILEESRRWMMWLQWLTLNPICFLIVREKGEEPTHFLAFKTFFFPSHSHALLICHWMREKRPQASQDFQGHVKDFTRHPIF